MQFAFNALGQVERYFIVAAIHTRKNNYSNTDLPRIVIFVTHQFIAWNSHTNITFKIPPLVKQQFYKLAIVPDMT